MNTETRPIIRNFVGPFKRATKTKPIKAKPLACLMIDQRILAKFLLDTLEGNQALKANSMVCLGISNDVWQQPSNKLLAKYTVVAVDDDGWLTCEPKPDNEVFAIQISEDMCGPGGFSIIGQWGEKQIVDGEQCFLQHGIANDYVLQSITDANDRWIVKYGFFISTYETVVVPSKP